jgi:hypothetical protein
MFPLTPVAPALLVVTEIEPLEVSTDAPVVRVIAPPAAAPAVSPAVAIMLPPALLSPCPTRTVIAPLDSAAAPVWIATAPLGPVFEDPLATMAAPLVVDFAVAI